MSLIELRSCESSSVCKSDVAFELNISRPLISSSCSRSMIIECFFYWSKMLRLRNWCNDLILSIGEAPGLLLIEPRPPLSMEAGDVPVLCGELVRALYLFLLELAISLSWSSFDISLSNLSLFSLRARKTVLTALNLLFFWGFQNTSEPGFLSALLALRCF